MNTMNRAGALVRVSTSKQLEGTSPDKQLEAIRALADEQGFAVPEEHTWLVAESGSLRDRTGFRQALEATETGLVTRLYVFSIDRLGRNLLEMLLFLRDLEDFGITCWEADRRRPLAWEDFILQIEGAVAGRERKEIIRRTQEGRLRSIRSGRFSGGMVAYGHKLNRDTKKLEVIDEEAAVVLMIFDWCVEERLSCRQIADRLNAMEVPTHYQKDNRKFRRKGRRAQETSGMWRRPQVQNMLRNTAYMGKWVYGKRSKKMRASGRIEVQCPAIVSPEMFYKAAQILERNRWPEPHNRRRQYLLRGLIRCGLCGSNYVVTTTKSKRGDERRYYRCNAA